MSDSLFSGVAESEVLHEYYFSAADGVDGGVISELRASTPDEPRCLAPLSSDPDLHDTDLAPLLRLTFCVLVLRNGSTVSGESICASRPMSDETSRRKIARQNAVAKLGTLANTGLLH